MRLKLFKYTFIATAAIFMLGICAVCSAGQWIAPDDDSVKPTPLGIGIFKGQHINSSPQLYRSVLQMPDNCDMAAAALRSSGWIYVWIDGQYIGGRDESTDEQAGPRRQLHLELGKYLTPGEKHVIVVSAPDGGFVLDGAFYSGTKRIGDIVSDASWSAIRYASGTVLEDQAVMRLDFAPDAIKMLNRQACSVRVADIWSVDDTTLLAAGRRIKIKRNYDAAIELRSRLKMLISDGDLLYKGRRTRWMGKVNTSQKTFKRAEYRLKILAPLIAQLKSLMAAATSTTGATAAATGSLEQINEQIADMTSWLDVMAATSNQREQKLAIDLAARAYRQWPSAELPDTIDMTPVELNRGGDMYDWLELADCFDSDWRKWGVRFNPIDITGIPENVEISGEWKFVVDPSDAGLMAGFYGRNNQSETARWPVRTIPHNWARDDDPQVASHKGVAWYNRSFLLPDQWAGMEVLLKITVEGDERIWVNGREVSILGTGYRKRSYLLPPEILAYGSENSIFVRVEADGAYRGLSGRATLSCPKLKSAAGRETPPVDIASSPLSPVVILRPRSDIIQIRHNGTAALAVPQKGTIVPTRNYNSREHRGLSENWAIVWLHPRNPWDVVRPILLVFQHNPQSMRCLKGVTEIKLTGPGETVMAVRPWTQSSEDISKSGVNLLKDARMWSRLARAVPINFVSVGQKISRGAARRTIAYDYLVTTDDWSVEPLYIAPLPPGASLALAGKNQAVGVVDDDKLVSLHEGGRFGPYQAMPDSRTISYVARPASVATPLRAVSMSKFSTVSPGEVSFSLISELGFNAIRWEHRWSDKKTEVIDAASAAAGAIVSTDKKLRPLDLAEKFNLGYIHAVEGLRNTADTTITHAQAQGYLLALSRDILKRLESFEAMSQPLALEICVPPTELHGSEILAQTLASLAELPIKSELLLQPPQPLEQVIAGELPTGARKAIIANGVRLDLSQQPHYSINTDRPIENVDASDIAAAFGDVLIEAVGNGKAIYCRALGFGLQKDAPLLPMASVQLLELLDQLGASWSFAELDNLMAIRDDGSIVISEQGRAISEFLKGR